MALNDVDQRAPEGLPADAQRGSDVAVLTGGWDPPYAFGLTMALARRGLRLDVIGGNEIDRRELRDDPTVVLFNLRGEQSPDAGAWDKIRRILLYYARLVRYAWTAQPRTFHVLWHNRFELFDRTALLLYYRALGKRIVLTAHNVNAGKRDSSDSILNRLGLRIQYRVADHIFVHTKAMGRELIEGFGVLPQRVTVIPFGINNAVPRSDVTSAQARARLGIADGERAILFFGNIGPYKGLEFLVDAFQRLAAREANYRLIIAGRPRRGCEGYVQTIQRAIDADESRHRVTCRIEHIPDGETELYFRAADVAVLPYTDVSQSGVLVLAYSFGLPVIASDVGSLREDIVEGVTGFLCRPADAADLARTIDTYFESALFVELERRRSEIERYAQERFSWEAVGRKTCRVYSELMGIGVERKRHLTETMR